MVYRALVSDAGYKDSPDDRPPGPRRRQTGILIKWEISRNRTDGTPSASPTGER